MKNLYNMEIIKDFCEENFINIEEVKIECTELPKFTRGLFRNGVIYFSNNETLYIRSSVEETILHELTHFLQWKEKRLFLPGDKIKRIITKILQKMKYHKLAMKLYYSIESEKEAIEKSKEFISGVNQERLTFFSFI